VSWSKIAIDKLVVKASTWNPKTSLPAAEFQYIDLSAIDRERKCINLGAVSLIECKAAPSRARQIVRVGDILLSTVRPNLNGVARVDERYDGATASTGYCLLRPKEKLLDSSYLFYWVQSKTFVDEMVKRATGANYPAVSDKIVKESKIPIPFVDIPRQSLAEQKRIANILDKANYIREKYKQVIELADKFLRVTFLSLFGDPITNPLNWDTQPLKSISSKIGSGATPRGGKSAYHSEGISLVRSMNIHDNSFRFKDLAFINDEQAKKLSNAEVIEGDVLLNITGASVCRVAMVEPTILPARVNQHVCIVRTEHIDNLYLLHLLISVPYKSLLLKLACAGGATREALTKEQVENLEIPIPPVALQQQFKKIVQSVEKVKARLEIQQSLSLLESLSQKAFKGEL
jgi:type I restriction enzyme S subunit